MTVIKWCNSSFFLLSNMDCNLTIGCTMFSVVLMAQALDLLNTNSDKENEQQIKYHLSQSALGCFDLVLFFIFLCFSL